MSKDTDGLSPFEENESPPLFDGQVISYRNADYLPNRKSLDQAAVKFFAEINSVIYILEQDRFHLWIDDVYSGKGVRASVLVIMYMVMALCGDENPSFGIARSYMDDVIEESSLESVRAIMLMVRLMPVRVDTLFSLTNSDLFLSELVPPKRGPAQCCLGNAGCRNPNLNVAWPSPKYRLCARQFHIWIRN